MADRLNQNECSTQLLKEWKLDVGDITKQTENEGHSGKGYEQTLRGICSYYMVCHFL